MIHETIFMRFLAVYIFRKNILSKIIFDLKKEIIN